jgi:hypothetical protein
MKHLAALSPGFWVHLKNAKLRGLEHRGRALSEIGSGETSVVCGDDAVGVLHAILFTLRETSAL